MHKYENVNCGKLIKIIWRKPLFDGLSFSIAEGQRAGIIGVNGTGKSTLLKIIAGAEIPDTGDMTHSRGYTISYLSQQPEFDEQLTVLEQVFHGDTPLIRLLRDYEKALLHIEKDPSNEKVQEQLFAVQQRMDAMSAWEANANAKSLLTKLELLISQQLLEIYLVDRKNVLRWRSVLLKHRIY